MASIALQESPPIKAQVPSPREAFPAHPSDRGAGGDALQLRVGVPALLGCGAAGTELPGMFIPVFCSFSHLAAAAKLILPAHPHCTTPRSCTALFVLLENFTQLFKALPGVENKKIFHECLSTFL